MARMLGGFQKEMLAAKDKRTKAVNEVLQGMRIIKFFAWEGSFLQKITGTGRCFIDLSGEVLAFDLQPGQSMRVHPGHVGLFQASITFQVVRVPGLKNRYMGDDGHHFAVMTGPGRIWLQSWRTTPIGRAFFAAKTPVRRWRTSP